MPYTVNRGFSVQTVGSNAGTWGADGTTPQANSSNALNEGMIQLVDQALGGTTTLSLASSNVLLTQLQAQNGMLRLTGTLLANVVVSPDTGVLMTGMYAWENVTSGNFTVTLSNAGGSVVLPQSRRGFVWINASNGPRIIAIAGSSAADPIPVGTVSLFYQAAAPTGWTLLPLSDYGIKIDSSSAGVLSGTIAYSTVFSRTATDSYTLTVADIPSHSHPVSGGTVAGFGTTTATVSGNTVPLGASTIVVGSTGGGGGHSHPIDLRLRAANVLLATKA